MSLLFSPMESPARTWATCGDEQRLNHLSEQLYALDQVQNICHAQSLYAGWWDTGRNVGEALALIHSELSEALEGHRKGLPDAHLPDRDSVEVELADALIRIFDLAGGLNLDLSGALYNKLAYNQRRADHTKEARAAEGGKKY